MFKLKYLKKKKGERESFIEILILLELLYYYSSKRIFEPPCTQAREIRAIPFDQ